MSIQILSTGSCLPDKMVTNDQLSTFLDTSDQWISSRTGISTRQVCGAETLTQLAVAAARQALERAKMSANSLDLILCATLQGDYIAPSLSCMVQQQLGAGCAAMDINAACSGFLYGLDAAEAYITSGKAANVLLIAAEQMTKLVDWQDRAACVLFGDGAGAAVLTAGESLQYIRVTASGNHAPLYLDGNSGNSPFAQQNNAHQTFLHMDGQEVFKFAVTTAGREIKRALAAAGLVADQIHHYLLHQANLRIVESVRTRLGQPEEKFPTNIGHTGNCSSASIAMLLDELVTDGRIQRGDRLLLTAFGAGMTAGTAILTW